MGAERRRVVVAPNVGEGMGGEAIKALNFFRTLADMDVPVALVTHARSRSALGDLAQDPRIVFVEDGPLQVMLWRSGVLSMGLDVVFHLAAARKIRQRWRPGDCLIHYLCPITPVKPRFPPRGYAYVLGPLSGAVAWPPAFRPQEGRAAALQRLLTPMLQALQALTGEKRRADAVLVSGGPETEASLRRAGARPERTRHVVDSGVSELFFAAPARHVGPNGRFIAIGRLVPYKGFDLAVEAVARTTYMVTLDIHGDGAERPRLEALVARLGLGSRVRFLGWLDNDTFAARIVEYRGLVFPTLAEANGIVMQEAMAAGVPTIALRWGGPARLAGDDAAAFVAAGSREEVIAGVAREMTSLASDPARAASLGAAARRIAERDFRWPAVAAAWMAACETGPDSATGRAGGSE